MRILWFTWKDLRHPAAGGAEVLNERLAAMLAKDGHEVTFIVGGFDGAAAEEERQGFRVIRTGGKWTVYWRAFLLYRRRFAGKIDLVIDEVNTIPFFCARYVRERNVMFVHQLARKVWFHEMWFPLNLFGWLAEPLYLRFLSGSRAITVSESTKRDLLRYGFSKENVVVIPQAAFTGDAPIPSDGDRLSKPVMLVFGAVRSMKRTHHVLRAFEKAKGTVPSMELVIAGSTGSRYGKRVERMVAASPDVDSVRILGKISDNDRSELFARASVLCVASVKEGWCLVVTEAGLHGVPAVAYDVDGLRDSVRDGETGVLVKDGDHEAMAAAVVRLCIDRDEYQRIQRGAIEWSRTFTAQRSHEAFVSALRG